MKLFKRISPFTGEDEVGRWIDKFENAIKIDGLEDRESSCLAMMLEGPAYDTWSGLSPEGKLDAATIKKELKRVYGPNKITAWRQASNKTTGVGENLDVVVAGLKKSVKIALADGDPVDAVTSLLFLEALPKQMRDEVSLKLTDTFSLTEVVQIAKKLWQNNSGALGSINALEVRKCFGCGNPGHLQRSCKMKCFKCGEVGHVQRFCKMGNEKGGDRQGQVSPP